MKEGFNDFFDLTSARHGHILISQLNGEPARQAERSYLLDPHYLIWLIPAEGLLI